MKRIIGISLASSSRDHKATIKIGKDNFSLERYGTDGDFKKARDLFLRYDDKASAFGLGGIDFYLGINKMHKMHAAWNLTNGLKTPVFDGSGIKESIDTNSLEILSKKIDFSTKKIFMVCACNRKGMAKYLEHKAGEIIYGDFMFGLKIPLAVRNLTMGEFLADMVLPIATRLPYKYLYPLKKKKTQSKFQKYFDWADIIAGDFHYINRYSNALHKKIVITTTITKPDIDSMRKKGASLLVITTPNLNGRSFGSNLIEALLYAKFGKDYLIHLSEMDFKPEFIELDRIIL
ncbi:MAG: quinate 5-dehydrogenase [archaeon]